MAREVLFEIQRLGNSAKVTAIDASTGEEVVVVAPAAASDHDLKALALRRLQRGRERKQDEASPPGRSSGKGIIV